ncbi:MAG TPA: YceI family protein, partial [Candidatus Binatia bacterium]|nr:YceI family protein [Candidatus Binatia bacterium]
PPPVGAATGDPGASGPSGSAAPLPTGTGTLGPDGPSGTWTIDTTIGSFEDFTSSFVGYRVDETFTDQRANTAVGRTPDVEGSLVLNGSTLTTVEVTADLTTLRSDDDRRDGQLRRQAIETEQFPTATFRLTSPVELGAVPVDGQAIETTATGELTLHGVTRTVEVPITARLSGDVVTVTGSIEIRFADYDIEQPRSFLVLSIEDHGIMEFQLHFRHG